MRRFIAALKYGEKETYINVEADRMTMDESVVYAWLNGELVAAVDMGIVLEAHLSDITGKQAKNANEHV